MKVVNLLLLLFALKLPKEFCAFIRNREFAKFLFYAILISTSSNFVSCVIRTFNSLWIKLQNCCCCSPVGINRLELTSSYQNVELILSNLPDFVQ